MTFRITDLEFHNFRSYEELQLHDLGMVTIFAGPNAAGKTNIVEGIQLLTTLSSFRHAHVDQLIRTSADRASLSLHARDEPRELDISLSLEEGKKACKINGKPKRAADIRGVIPSVAFTPDDLNLAKGGQSVRRHALDALGSQVSANYHLVLKDCEKVLAQKNKLLKEGCSTLLLDSIDDALVVCGAQLTCLRASLFERLARNLADIYKKISRQNEECEAWFVPSWEEFDPRGMRECEESGCAQSAALGRDDARRALQEALASRRVEERERRRALVGPHADTVHFSIDGLSASAYASQGQQRSLVLAYKLAEACLIEEVLGQKPVLLLDDVMSELDGARREALVDYISHDVQTFITTANLSYFDDIALCASDVVKLPLGSS